jgi:uncharacterized protein (TIGR00375 family)
MEYFADLHVHVGCVQNRPVKITASKKMTLPNIFDACINKKGINILGLVDCASPKVISEIENYLKTGELIELKRGGLSYKNELTIILGAEIETVEGNNAAHSIAFFPHLVQMKKFSSYMSKYIRNINLSSQRAYVSAFEVLKIVNSLGGDFIPAHIFTPFKSLYGKCYDRLSCAFKDRLGEFYAVELGLSADTNFADMIKELSYKRFLSNSDAHSLEKIAREYNKFNLEAPTYDNIFSALKKDDQKNYIVGNYGLNPLLGKYHRTRCLCCGYIAEIDPPVKHCPKCLSTNVVLGVLDRITQIADYKTPVHPVDRPPYYYQIPLEFLPGIGKRTIEKLVYLFGSEMNILHSVDFDLLVNAIGKEAARKIVKGRHGELKLKSGGGGMYGKITS